MWEKGGCEEEEEGMGWLPSLAWESGDREEVHKRKKEKCIRGRRKLSTFGLVANVLRLLFRAPIPSRGTLEISVILLRREGEYFRSKV